jgi:hypothetical protein
MDACPEDRPRKKSNSIFHAQAIRLGAVAAAASPFTSYWMK